MKRSKKGILSFILFLTVIAIIIDFPTVNYNINLFGRQIKGTLRGPDIDIRIPLIDKRIRKELKLWEGLDLQGGIQLIYSADMTEIEAGDRVNKLQEIVNKIDRRINQLGVTEPLIQSSVQGDTYRVIVEIPGISDVEQAKQLIGATARLEFREYKQQVLSVESTGSGEEDVVVPQTVATYVPLGLTGDDFYRAEAGIDTNPNSPSYNKPIVKFEFKDEAAQEFSDITERLNNEGGVLGIFLDETNIFEGRTEHITDGKGQISGLGTMTEAKNLAIQLNEGALPVPISVVSEQTVSPTLGSESVHKSVIAGLIGIVAISLFMIIYYHLLGFIAVVALCLYTLFSIAIFKLIPVTLTMGGIAGFILSVGMAVDASILIFERFKEELRAGKTLAASLDIGFRRAWSSIRDSNVSSIITCSILYFLGTGVVRGFALTLIIGILVSMFTAITVTRNFIETMLRFERFKDLRWYGIKSTKD